MALFAYLALTAAGTYACYQENRAGDDKNFLDRFVCLALPVGLRWTIAFYAACLIGYGINAVSGGLLARELPFDTNTLQHLYGTLALILYYVWLRSYIGIASGASSAVRPLTEEPQTSGQHEAR